MAREAAGSLSCVSSGGESLRLLSAAHAAARIMALAILGIETSTPYGGMALATPEGALLAHRWGYARTGYSRRLMGSIDAALRESGVAMGEIAAIAVTNGPGSFTGVRVGLTTAKTLAHSLGVPLYLFSTLDALERRWPAPGVLCAALDARRSEVYSALYEVSVGAEPQPLRAAHAEKCAALIDALEAAPELAGREIWMTGDGAALYRPMILDRLGARARFVPAPHNRPAADSVALMGARALAAGLPGVNPMQAAPDYLRVSDAERNLAPSPA